MTLKPGSIPQPLENIGCQDLLTEEYTQCGWLRKKHFMSKLKLFRWPQVYVVLSKGCLYYFRSEYSEKSSGKFSLYGYNSVHRAEDVDKAETQWAFKIIHTHAEEFKTYFFSASSEKEMKTWMRLIKAELIQANGQKGRDENYYYTYRNYGSEAKEFDDDKTSLTYQDIEQDIYDDASKFRRPKDYGAKKEVKRTGDASDDEDIPDDPRKSDLSTGSRSSGYESGDRPPQPLPDFAVPPPIPERPGRQPPTKQKKKKKKQRSVEKQSSGESQLPPPLADRPLPPDRPLPSEPSLPSGFMEEISKKTKGLNVSSESKTGTLERTKGKPLPEPPVEDTASAEVEQEEEEEVGDDEYWKSIYFNDPSNEKANEIIRQIGENGVYLIRGGATGGHVLVVFANNMPKKYRVQFSDNQYFLGRDGPHCDSLEELLYEYYQRHLPTVDVMLTTPYKLHPQYKKLPKS